MDSWRESRQITERDNVSTIVPQLFGLDELAPFAAFDLCPATQPITPIVNHLIGRVGSRIVGLDRDPMPHFSSVDECFERGH